MPTVTTISQGLFSTVRREPYLVGYWRANDVAGAIDAQDSGPYDLTGIYQNSQQLGPALIQGDSSAASSIFGAGAWLAANNAGFHVSNVSQLQITGALSLEAWISPYAAGQTCHLLGKLNSAGTKAAPYALRLVAGVLQFAVGNGTTETTLTLDTPPLGAPSHVVATSFRGATKLYLNGVPIASGSLGAQTQTDGAQSFYVGAIGTSSPFAGLMSEVAVYNGALSAVRVARHFSVGQQVYPDAAHYLGVDPPTLVA